MSRHPHHGPVVLDDLNLAHGSRRPTLPWRRISIVRPNSRIYPVMARNAVYLAALANGLAAPAVETKFLVRSSPPNVISPLPSPTQDSRL